MKTTTNTTILLLISYPVVRAVITEALQPEGYTVVAAGDLGTAVERLTEFRPDLLIIRSYVESIPDMTRRRFYGRSAQGCPC
jgi:CheY-like chemotaxis protein